MLQCVGYFEWVPWWTCQCLATVVTVIFFHAARIPVISGLSLFRTLPPVLPSLRLAEEYDARSQLVSYMYVLKVAELKVPF